MSIETLLEAAKFLELQAQQQQKAREENELRDKLRLEQLAEHSISYSSQPLHYTNHVFKAEAEPHSQHHRPAPVLPPAPPPAVPITVIPVTPVVPSSNHTAGSPSPHHHPVATLLASPKRDPHSPQDHQSGVALSPPRQPKLSPSALAVSHNQPQNLHHQHHLQLVASPSADAKTQQQQQPQQPVQQRYPGTIVSAPQPQHALVAQLPQAPPPQTSPVSRGSPPDDGRHLDNKKRPGGRAHLKDCFETLKKNIPNVDEKKTSNLSVLRSALRYIQTLKRKEKEYEHEMERLAREKIATQQRLAELKKELGQWMDVMEMERVLRQTVQPEEDQASTSTASEGEDLMDDDLDDATGPRVISPAPRLPLPSPRLPLPSPRVISPAPRMISPAPRVISPAPRVISPAPRVPPGAPGTTIALPSTTTQALQPYVAATLMPIPPTTTLVAQHVSIQRQPLQPPPSHRPVTLSPQQPLSSKPTAPYTPSAAAPTSTPVPIQAVLPTHATLQPTVIAHTAASHTSVIQAVNHVIQAGGPKHISQLVPSATAGGVHLTAGHITVHPLPVAHLSQHLPALYPQPGAALQPAMLPTMLGHITHTLTHAQVNGTVPGQLTTTMVGKQQAAVGTQVVTHHPQLVGQTMTMVTMPSYPVSTLKLA